MHLIVDAFNVLHAWGTGPDSGGFKEIESLAGLIQSSRYGSGRVSLVCDGAPLANTGPLPGLCKAIYAGGGQEADGVIETLIARDSGPRELILASSDRRLQRAARRRGGRWLASPHFLSQIIRDSASPAREPLRPAFARKAPLTDRAVDRWLIEFDIPADFAGPGSEVLPSPPPRPVDPKKKPREHRDQKHRPQPPLQDPLLREALEHWQGRLRVDDLDMNKWLGDGSRR